MSPKVEVHGRRQKTPKGELPMTGLLPLRPHHNRRAMQWEQLDTSWNRGALEEEEGHLQPHQHDL